MQQLIKYDQNDWILFIRISLYALIFSLSCQWFTITHEYGMAEDVRQHVWTYVSSWRPDLFQNDLIGDYVGASILFAILAAILLLAAKYWKNQHAKAGEIS